MKPMPSTFLQAAFMSALQNVSPNSEDCKYVTKLKKKKKKKKKNAALTL